MATGFIMWTMIYVISMEFLPLYTQLIDGIKAMSGGISGG